MLSVQTSSGKRADLIVHDRTQAHDAHMDVIFFAHQSGVFQGSPARQCVTTKTSDTNVKEALENKRKLWESEKKTKNRWHLWMTHARSSTGGLINLHATLRHPKRVHSLFCLKFMSFTKISITVNTIEATHLHAAQQLPGYRNKIKGLISWCSSHNITEYVDIQRNCFLHTFAKSLITSLFSEGKSPAYW